MKAYWQPVRGGILRMDAEGHGEPYRFSVTVDLDYKPPFASIVGLSNILTPKEFEFIVSRINEETGKLVYLDRMKGMAVSRSYQTDPRLTDGKIVFMTKIHTPHANTVTNKDEHFTHMLAAMANVNNGHSTLVPIDLGSIVETPSADGKGRRFAITGLVVEVHDK